MKVTIAQLEKIYAAVVVYLNGTCQCDCEDCNEFRKTIDKIREEQFEHSNDPRNRA